MPFSRLQGAFGVRQVALNLIRILLIVDKYNMWVGASAPTLWKF
jgi:hypothetical protein